MRVGIIVLEWLQSYLAKRLQYVELRNEVWYSPMINVRSSVVFAMY